MKGTKRILILYTELAGYTLASLRALQQTEHVAVHLIRWPVNNEAPFDFEFDKGITVCNRKEYTPDKLVQLAETIQPDLILCSGWTDKGYLAVCKAWKNKIPVVLTMDNKWQGTLRQRAAAALSVFLVRKYFNRCWVPGDQQKEFALKLGFKERDIRTGFYSCDIDAFNAVYHSSHQTKAKQFPRVFIYAGRFYDFKGVNELWNAYREFSQINTDWRLICVGNGDQKPPDLPRTEFRNFIQPPELRELMKVTGVFIMPSKKEPWGVVAQEFAAAGFPLLLSREVAAAGTFLQEGVNGYSFAAGSTEELISAMKKIAQSSDSALMAMGEKSHQLAQRITPRQWAETLLSFTNRS